MSKELTNAGASTIKFFTGHVRRTRPLTMHWRKTNFPDPEKALPSEEYDPDYRPSEKESERAAGFINAVHRISDPFGLNM